MTAQLFPSIDLRGGRVVRLRQGDYARETAYGDDPVAVAENFCADGAEWIHVVDLDAARTGVAANRRAIGEVGCSRRRTSIASRQAEACARSTTPPRSADAGVARVVMGSAAVADPPLVDAVAGRVAVAVALDHRRGVVAVEGWTSASTMTLADGLGRFPAAEAFVITDIERDGELSGPDLDGIATAVATSDVPVIASGGVASLDDVRALAEVGGLGGIITGRALYEGRFTVAEALGVIGRAVAP